MKNIIRSVFIIFVVIFSIFLNTGCIPFKKIFRGKSLVKVTPVMVRVNSITLKIGLAVGSAVIKVAVEEFTGVEIDTEDLLKQIIVGKISKGIPEENVPTLVVINKKSNDILHWKLTKQVKIIRLKSKNPGEIDLKVINQDPLRIELWVGADLKDIEVTVELKNPTN